MPLIPPGSEVVAGALAESIVECAKWGLRSCADLTHEQSALLRDPDGYLSQTVAEAVSPLGEVECVARELGGNRFRDFLRSADLYNLFQRMFLIALAPAGDDAPAMEREFVDLWALWVQIPSEALDEHVDRIFTPISRAIEAAAQHAVHEGMTQAVRPELQTAVVSRHLAAIERRLALLDSEPALDDFIRFEAEYRDQVAARFAQLTPPHLDDARRVRIEHIYVEPQFVWRRAKRWSEDKRPLDVVRADLMRTVVLGQPGGGKSTLTAKLCHDLSSQYGRRLVGGLDLTPVPIVLRDYGQAKGDRHLSILDFVTEFARSDLQLEPPVGVFDYMFQQGRALVIFDGLDELVTPRARKSIRDDIESFCTRYPATRVLVTSREIGYDMAPLDDDAFAVLGLSEFDDDQVESYVHRWFAAHPEVPAQQKRRQADAFLRESASVASDLRRNPLLLALMCNIYKGEGYIPTNRPSVYEKCSNMLLRRWDASRGIEVSRPLGAYLERTLEHVANWMFESQELQSGVTESRLIEVAATYLAERRFDDEEEARTEAQNFLEFCKGRSWVLIEVGTSRTESLFQFAHRTFLEYFTADYIVRNSRSIEALWARLSPKLGHPAWDVVAQLAFQLKNSYQEAAGDELLELVLQAFRDSPGRSGPPKLLFAVRALQFLVPAPVVTRHVTESALAHAVTAIATRRDRSTIRRPSRGVEWELITELCEISDENVAPAAAATRVALGRLLESDEATKEAAAAAAIVLDYGRYGRAGRLRYFESTCSELTDEYSSRISAIATRDEGLARLEVSLGRRSASNYAQQFGPSGLFERVQNGLSIHPPWSGSALMRVRRLGQRPNRALLAELAALGDVLRVLPLPWLRDDGRLESWGIARLNSMPDTAVSMPRLGPQVTFGIFTLLLPYAESHIGVSRVASFANEVLGDAGAPMTRVLTAGLLATNLDAGLEAITELGWRSPAADFAIAWMNSDVGPSVVPSAEKPRSSS